MNNDQKLRLVPMESLNKLTKMLSEQNNEKQLLLSILNPEQHVVLQRKRKLEKSLEEGDTDNLSTNMIQFNKVQGELIKNTKEEKELKNKALNEQAKPKANALPVGVKQDPRQRILELMGTKNISINNGLLYQKGKSTGVNAEDFLHDITHQARKRFNLDHKNREKALAVFAKAGLPASYIINHQIKEEYLRMRNQIGSFSPSSSSSDEGSGVMTPSTLQKIIDNYETISSPSTSGYMSRKKKSKKNE